MSITVEPGGEVPGTVGPETGLAWFSLSWSGKGSHESSGVNCGHELSQPVSRPDDMGAQNASFLHPMKLLPCWGQRTKHHRIMRPRLGPWDVLHPIKILSCWLSTWADGAIAGFTANRALVLLVEGRAVSVVESGSEQGHGQVIPQAPGEGGRWGYWD